MSDVVQGSGCACCVPTDESTDRAAIRDSAVRVRFVAGAEQLGIDGDELADLGALFDAGDCATVQRRMAAAVRARLAAAELRMVEQIEHAAHVQAERGGNAPGLSAVTAGLQTETTDLAVLVARPPAVVGACGEECACVTAASAVVSPRIPAARAALADSTPDGPDLVCTLDGGIDAMHGRISEWQAVPGREPADGGVSVTFVHDPALTVELHPLLHTIPPTGTARTTAARNPSGDDREAAGPQHRSATARVSCSISKTGVSIVESVSTS